MKPDHGFRRISLTLVWFWLLVFAMVPLVLVTIASFLSHNNGQLVSLPFTLQNYAALGSRVYIRILQQSFYIAGGCTLICLLLGYPFAWLVARMQMRARSLMILLIIIPFWTSSLIRSYSMITLLKPGGVINSLLMWTGLISKPLPLLFSDTAVMTGLVYNLLPFMVLPLLTNIERLDDQLIDAARDLGANRLTTFRKVILPLTLPGILSGCILVFLPAMTLFYIPDLLGGSKSILLGNLIQNQFLVAQNWPLGSAVSMVFTLMLIVLLVIYWRAIRHDVRRELA